MTTTTHGAHIRCRRIAARLLYRLESLALAPALRWLRLARWLLCLASIAAYAANWRMDTLILLVATAVVQLIIMQQVVVGLLRREE